MGKIFRGNALIYIYTLLGVLSADLITKELAQEYLSDRHYSPFPFLKLFLIHNKGAAFGFFSDLPDIIRVPLLTLTPVVAFLVTYIYSGKDSRHLFAVAMGMIGGGALGNLYDRIFLGEVRDFIHLHAGNFYWPAFNLADASITIALGILIFHTLRK